MRRVGALPCDDDVNGWTAILPPRAPRPALSGQRRADWLVIGAGFAGLAAARRLAENQPDAEIALLEAQAVGDGASGRNSGFVIDLPHNVGAADLANLEASRRAMRLARAAAASLEAVVAAHGIDCQWHKRGQYLAAVSAAGEAALAPYTAELDALGEPFRRLDRAATASALGTAYYRAAVHTPGTVLMQPAALVRGLADSLPANVTLYENTPVVAIDYGSRIRAETPKGAVEVPAVVLAVNGFAPHFGQFRGRVFVCRAFASLTRPLADDEIATLGGEDDEWGLVPTNPFAGATLRLTADRRILFRQAIEAAAPGARAGPTRYAAVRARHEALLAARFPALRGPAIAHTWAGQICLSRNFAPGFGRPAANVFTAVCQNAVGVTKGTISGLLAADLASQRDNPLLADMEALGAPVALPPRPFLDLGVRASLAWWKWRGRGER